ncbi:unnamed protein product [Wuchereria bancrofti]|uniref:Uncharacterized protein n=1 Tax=Wuchereria bancrofti TaxID=6293 RepID=A0A3P7DVC7_WUCBA|nr:unnamed protein product [Wuchereria bancrofti]
MSAKLGFSHLTQDIKVAWVGFVGYCMRERIAARLSETCMLALQARCERFGISRARDLYDHACQRDLYFHTSREVLRLRGWVL